MMNKVTSHQRPNLVDKRLDVLKLSGLGRQALIAPFEKRISAIISEGNSALPVAPLCMVT